MTTTDASNVPPTEAPLRILLVDDDDAVRGVINRVLGRLGHEVCPCASAAQARSAPAFEVALVDLNLGAGPEGGRELLDELRAHAPQACYVLTSGSRPALPSPEDGGPLFLEKPFSRGDLVALLAQARDILARNRAP